MVAIPAIVSDTLELFSGATGIDHFCLIGGAAIDTLMDNAAPPHDWDLIILPEAGEPASLCSNFRRGGFTLGEPRSYRLNKVLRTVNITAERADIGCFDVAFMPNMSFVGPFNLESLYLEMPARQYVDPHDTLTGIGSGRIKFVREPLANEIPTMLMKRFLVLTAKYGLRFGKMSANHDTVQLLHLAFDLEGWPRDDAEQRADKIGCLSKLLGAILRVADKQSFIIDLSETHLLERTLPEIAAVVAGGDLVPLLLTNAPRTKCQLVDLLLQLDRSDKTIRLLAGLGERPWDAHDQETINHYPLLKNRRESG